MFNSYVKLPEGIFPNSWDHDPIWRTHIFQGGCIETTNQHRLGDEKGTSSSWKYLKNAVSPTNLFVSRTVVYSSQAVQTKTAGVFHDVFFCRLGREHQQEAPWFFSTDASTMSSYQSQDLQKLPWDSALIVGVVSKHFSHGFSHRFFPWLNDFPWWIDC